MLLCAEYVIPVTSDPIENGAVLVRDGRIADVGPAVLLRARYAEEEVREFKQAVLMPGLVNVHSHVEYSVLRGMVADLPYPQWVGKVTAMADVLDAATLYDSALVGGLEMLISGITCVGTVTQSESTVRAMGDLGLRSVVYREVGAVDARRVDFAMRQAVTDIERWQENVDAERMSIGIAAAPVYDCHPKVFKRVAEYAGDTLPVALHIAASYEEYEFIRYGRNPRGVEGMMRRGYVEVPPWLPTGVTPVNYALNWGGFDAGNVMAVHAVHVSDEDILALRNRNVAIGHCPRTNSSLGMGVAPLNEYLKAGLRIGLGTDSPAATEAGDIFAEMRTGMQLQRATSPQNFLLSDTMLELGTIGGAEVLGLADSIGSLEVGKKADVIAVDLSSSHSIPTKNPIAAVVNTAVGSNVLMTMIGGRILYDNGGIHLDIDIFNNVEHVIATRSQLRSQF